MTNEQSTGAAAVSTVDALKADIEKAKAAIVTANAEAAKVVPALVAAGKFGELAVATAPVQAAERALKSLEAKLEAATRESRWAGFDEQRKPVLAVLNSLIKGKPMAPVTAVRGRIEIKDVEYTEGDVTGTRKELIVTLKPTVQPITLDGFEAQIEEAIDMQEWLDAGMVDMDISISRIGAADFNVNNDLRFGPSALLNDAGKKGSVAGDTARVGAVEYNFNGEWLGTGAFLAALKAQGGDFVTKNASSFDDANLTSNGKAPYLGGNGFSNLAKRAAKAMNVDTRTKAKAE